MGFFLTSSNRSRFKTMRFQYSWSVAVVLIYILSHAEECVNPKNALFVAREDLGILSIERLQNNGKK